MASPRRAEMCLKQCVLRMFYRIRMIFAAIRLTRSKARSIPSECLLKSLLRMGLGTIFWSLLGRLGSEKNDENIVFYERFAIFGRIWLQHGTFVVQWFGKHFHSIFCRFSVAPGVQKRVKNHVFYEVFVICGRMRKYLEQVAARRVLKAFWSVFCSV